MNVLTMGIIGTLVAALLASTPAETMEPYYEPEVIYEESIAAKGDGYYLGECLISAYCACEQCCGKSDGITATGTYATQGRTVAVDPSVIPYGSTVIFNGHEYIAEDCGGAIGGTRIDLFFNNHQEALNWGMQWHDVWIK